jgi:hypothetical protein
MLNKCRVEVFSAGCALCHGVIDAVRGQTARQARKMRKRAKEHHRPQ